MITKLKYIFCVALTLVLTATVIFMPYIYYSFDGAEAATPKTEKFTIADSGEYEASFEEIYQLVHDDSAIWIDDDNYNEKLLIQKLSDELSEVYWFLSGNDYTLAAYNRIKEFPIDSPNIIESVVVSGTVDDKSVSVPLVFMEYESSFYNEENEYGSVFGVLMNRNSGKIYQLAVGGTDPLNESISSYYDYDSIYSYVTAAIGKYLDADVSEKMYVHSFDDLFEYIAFNQDFYELRYRTNQVVYYDDSEETER